MGGIAENQERSFGKVEIHDRLADRQFADAVGGFRNDQRACGCCCGFLVVVVFGGADDVIPGVDITLAAARGRCSTPTSTP